MSTIGKAILEKMYSFHTAEEIGVQIIYSVFLINFIEFEFIMKVDLLQEI